MENKVIELYDRQEIEKGQLSNQRWTVAICIFAALCLAACITLCCLLNLRNEQTILTAVMAIVVVGGWVIIYVLTSVIGENKRQIVHARNMLGGERSEHVGGMRIGKDKIKISGSITIVKVTLTDGEKTETLNVNASRADKLKDVNGRVKLYAVHGYAVACEVCDEND